jgi:hypothetical protein
MERRGSSSRLKGRKSAASKIGRISTTCWKFEAMAKSRQELVNYRCRSLRHPLRMRSERCANHQTADSGQVRLYVQAASMCKSIRGALQVTSQLLPLAAWNGKLNSPMLPVSSMRSMILVTSVPSPSRPLSPLTRPTAYLFSHLQRHGKAAYTAQDPATVKVRVWGLYNPTYPTLQPFFFLPPPLYYNSHRHSVHNSVHPPHNTSKVLTSLQSSRDPSSYLLTHLS